MPVSPDALGRVRAAQGRAVPADRGMVTAETAVVLPVLLVTLAAAVWLLACLSAQLSCVDAARLAARAAARGDPPVQVVPAAARIAPPGARIVVRPEGGQVMVTVQASVRPFGAALARLPAVAVGARASAVLESSGEGRTP